MPDESPAQQVAAPWSASDGQHTTFRAEGFADIKRSNLG